jgi:hypothetical protein
MSGEVLGALGYPVPLRARCFQTAPRSFSATGPRFHFKRTGSSSPELHLPFRVCSCSRHLLDTRRYRTPPLGFRPPSRRECRVHNVPGSHTRLCSALSVSHTPDGFLLRKPRGLVSSHNHVRDSLFRGFPRCQAGLPHRQGHTLMPFCETHLPVSCPTGASRFRADFRVSIQAAIRCRQQVV